MADYEKEIARPLKNAIFGEMSRLLLIQVQKQKGAFEQADQYCWSHINLI